MHEDLIDWVKQAFHTLVRQLENVSDRCTSELLLCGNECLQQLRLAVTGISGDIASRDQAIAILDTAINDAYKNMSIENHKASPTCWRRLYTDACLYRTIADVAYVFPVSESVLLDGIARLDSAIIIAGPSGEQRLEFILEFIERMQSVWRGGEASRPPTVTSPRIVVDPVAYPLTFSKHVQRLDSPPSFATFISRSSQQPFVLTDYIRDWPAMNDHPWKSLEYLRRLAGPGRVVPIEVGSDYRSEDWTQEIMSLDKFLDALNPVDSNEGGIPVLYMAQHSLFRQIPALRDDINIPDYVYASLPPPSSFPEYRPPVNAEQLVINSWLGPAGTMSPAHTDPYYNFYAQVVGRKTVWLAPPECTPYMYAHSNPVDVAAQSHNPAQNTTEPSMSNTSRVDVFSQQCNEQFPAFCEHVIPKAICTTLLPGDLLFFPPGWWHAMRSEDVSFSVSMWF